MWIHYRQLLYTLTVLLCIATAVLPDAAQEAHSAVAPGPEPATRIDLSSIGFHEPSRMDRTAEYQPSLSLDFVDAQHILLTFNRKQLIKRQPECTPDHEDRLMHAAILEIPTGRLLTETDWYLHDRRRYLWRLSTGKFLLRKWNSLYIVDSDLHETLLLKSPKDLLWVSVTPDGSQVITETGNDTKPADSARKTPPRPEPKYVVRFLDVKTLAAQRTLLFNNFTNLTGTSTGYADVIRKRDIWLLRFGPAVNKRHNLARVRSQTVPVVLYPTGNTLLIGRCAASACNYGVTAFTLTGQRLWRQHWPGLRSFPEVARSDDNSRFSVSTLLVELASAGASSADDSDDDPFQTKVSDRDVLRQEIQVLDTATGTPALSVSISPAVVTGQNVALSPDGRRLALLRGSALELFDLPPMSNEEQTKFVSLRTDTLGLYSLGSTADADWWDSSSTASNSPDNLTADASAGAATDESPASPAAAHAGESGQPASGTSNSPTPSTVADAAEKIAPPDTLPIFKVSTKAVVVDVVVTDSKGHPVRGLSQQDFQLTEDNKPQEVRYFREFSDLEKSSESSSGPVLTTQVSSTASTSTSASQTPPAPAPSPNVFNNRAHSAQQGAVTMVLFDTLNTPPQDQAFARLQLIKFLESKPKMSQFALCMLSSGAYPLRLIQGFTEDETLLLAAVRAKKGQPRNNRWQAAQTETRNSVNTVAALAQEGRTSGFQNLVGTLQEMQDEQLVTDTSERASRTIDAMMLLARYLSGISGRKNIVWLSASFPIAIPIGPVSSNPSIDNPNYTYKIKRATNLLADAQVAVYPVDVRGLQVFTASLDSGVAVAGPRSFQPIDPTSPNPAAPPSSIPQGMDFTDQAAEQDTFTQFAVATGGKAFFNSNDIREAIATANEQGSNYYSFSYTSTNKIYDGKFRKIKLQFDHKGYKLYYRQGYFADEVNAGSKEAQLARNAIATAMHYGSPPAREVQFSVRVWPVGGKKKVDRSAVGEVKMASKKKESLPPQLEVQHYVVDYTLDGSELRFIPQQNGSQHSSLALMITSFNSDGRMLTGLSTRAQSDLQSEAYTKVINGEVGFQQEVDIPIEATSMRLGVQDQMSNHLGTVDVPLPVPPDPNAPKIARNKLPEMEPD